MSEVQKPIVGSEKAGNSQKIIGKHTLINWETKTIIHNYELALMDSDGDILKTEGSGNVVLAGETFDLWINQDMKDATLLSMVEQYEASQIEE